jgi:hypothetical protein
MMAIEIAKTLGYDIVHNKTNIPLSTLYDWKKLDDENKLVVLKKHTGRPVKNKDFDLYLADMIREERK